MYRYGYVYARGIRFLCSCSTSSRVNWDPIVALKLKEPALVLLEKCSTRNQFKRILGHMMRNNLVCETFPMSRLLFFSALSHPENLDLAILLFNNFTPYPNLYIYNIMILALSFSTNQCFSIYNAMLKNGVFPDRQTFLYLLQTTKFVSEVRQVHCHALVIGLLSNEYLQNSLMKGYMENGYVGSARQMFDEMTMPDVVSYNILIVGFAKMGDISTALQLFCDMERYGIEPDDVTMLGLLLSCGQLGKTKLGKSVHARIEKSNSSSNLILFNALLDMYVRCKELKLAERIFNLPLKKNTVSWNTMIAGYAKVGELKQAREIFNQIPSKDVVSWNSLIAGYTQTDDYMMVKDLFTLMFAENNTKPDEVTMVTLISAIAEIGALDQGRWIHGLAVKMHPKLDGILGSALIEMYYKCGSIERAYVIFKQIHEKDVTTWTTMITGFAYHGYGNKALKLFSNMQPETKPNDVTFISVLAACSHSGFVDEGLKIFSSMKNMYRIEPGVEHYGCLVDLLARSGRLSDAIDVIKEMPMKPSRSIWGAVLSGCRTHGDMEIAERALRELLKLEPEEEGGYVLISNIYANCGMWGNSDTIREVMNRKRVKKIAGCSSVVVDGHVHDFTTVNKQQHPRWLDICSMISFLTNEIKSEVDDIF